MNHISNINTVNGDSIKSEEFGFTFEGTRKEIEETMKMKEIITNIDRKKFVDLAEKYGYTISGSQYSHSLYLSKRDEESGDWINLRVSNHWNHLDNKNAYEYVEGDVNIAYLRALNKITDYKFSHAFDEEIKKRNLFYERIREENEIKNRITNVKESRRLMKSILSEKNAIKEIKEELEKKIMSLNTQRSRRALEDLQQLNRLYDVFDKLRSWRLSYWNDLVGFDLGQKIDAIIEKIEDQELK